MRILYLKTAVIVLLLLHPALLSAQNLTKTDSADYGFWHKNSSVDLFTVFNFEKESEDSSDNGVSAVSLDYFVYGTKIKMPFGQVNFFSKSTEENKNLGISLSSQKFTKDFPSFLLFGNLSAGGSLSLLKNPLLSAFSSPFSASSTSTKTVSAALPSYSVFSKPYSAFLQLGYQNKKNILREAKINILYTPLQNHSDFFNPRLSDFLFSGSAGISPLKNLEFSAAFTGGLFEFQKNTFSSWFTTADYFYHEDSLFCMNGDFSVSYKNFSTLFSSYFYQSPEGGFMSVLKTDNLLKLNRAVFSLSALYNNNQNLITTDSTNLKKCFQLKASNQIKFLIPLTNQKTAFLKTGFSLYDSINLKSEENKIKTAAGLQFSTSLTAITIYTLLNFSLTKVLTTSLSGFSLDFDSFSLQLKNLWYLKYFTPEFLVKFSSTPSADSTYVKNVLSLSWNFLFKKSAVFNFPSAFSVTLKNDELEKWNFSTGIKASFSRWNINYNLNLSIEFLSDS